MDLNYTRDTTSGREGLDLLPQIRALDSALPVVVMTAWGSIELAVEAMKKGVGDFVLKPWENRRLLATLRAQIAQGRERRKTQQLEEVEHEDARKIQQGLLPQRLPQVQGYEIASVWQPAKAVGGDYYDVFELRAGKIVVCIADVMGKGMPAALLMSNLQAAIKSAASDAKQPSEICARVNRIICSNVADGKFITLFYGTLDAEARRLVYTNAGHNAPILLSRNGSCSRLQKGGAALGAFPDWNYEQGEIRLEAGDRLALFTDGVTEARNAVGEEFGEARLITLLKENREFGAAQLQRKILEATSEFSDRKFEDDATLVVMAVDDMALSD